MGYHKIFEKIRDLDEDVDTVSDVARNNETKIAELEKKIKDNERSTAISYLVILGVVVIVSAISVWAIGEIVEIHTDKIASLHERIGLLEDVTLVELSEGDPKLAIILQQQGFKP